jgi:DNA-binding NtrC family response regulator
MTLENENRVSSGARELLGHEVLVVDADDKVHKGLLQLLAPAGLHLTAIVDADKAMDMVSTKFFGVVVLDLDTPFPGGGLKLLEQVHERSPQSTVIVLTPRKSFESAVEAFRHGASDVIWKSPDQVEYLKDRVVAAMGQVRARGSRGELLHDVHGLLEECLKVIMASERRAIELEEKAAGQSPDRFDADEEVRILCIDADERLFKALTQHNPKGFAFTYAQSGGEALDRVTNSRFQIALCGPSVPDLPTEMVIRALKSQSPEMITISYVPNGKLQIVDGTRSIPIVDKFTSATQLSDRLNELAAAHRARGRERRYLQAFRETHYDFLRRFAELRQRIEKASTQQ